MQFNAGEIAGLLVVIGHIPYVQSVINGRATPSWATWWIWVVVNGLLFSSFYKSGGGDAAWATAASVVGSVIIAVLSIKYGEGKWDRLDQFCLVAAAAIIILWIISSSAIGALYCSMALDITGAIPTLRATFRNPHHEDWRPWGIWLIANTVNFWAVDWGNLAILPFPIYSFVLAAVMFILGTRSRILVQENMRPRIYQRDG